MLLGNFVLHRPRTSGELFALIAELEGKNESFSFLSGGTDLIPNLKRVPGQTPGHLLSLGGISRLKRTFWFGNEVDIGATVSLSEIAESLQLGERFPALCQAAELIASPQIRSSATIGGNINADNRCPYYNQAPLNRASHEACFKTGGEHCPLLKITDSGVSPLCHARAIADLVPVLLVLEATVKLNDGRTRRRINLSDYFSDDGIERNVLKPGELLESVVIPFEPSVRIAYRKLRVREAFDFPSLGLAVGYRMDEPDFILVALTGTNPRPLFLKIAVSAEDRLSSVQTELLPLVKPLRQDFFPPAYRREMISCLLAECIAALETDRTLSGRL